MVQLFVCVCVVEVLSVCEVEVCFCLNQCDAEVFVDWFDNDVWVAFELCKCFVLCVCDVVWLCCGLFECLVVVVDVLYEFGGEFIVERLSFWFGFGWVLLLLLVDDEIADEIV